MCSYDVHMLWYGTIFVVSLVYFFKQKTAYEMRISDLSSDVCSSDLVAVLHWRRASIRPAPPARSPLVFHAHRIRPRPLMNRGTASAKPSAKRSAERRVGKEWVSTCRSRWSSMH